MRETTVLRRWLPTSFLRLSAGLHGAVACGLVLAPQHWPLLVGGLIANHALIAGAGLWPRSRLLGANVTRVPAGGADEVALTFDDGPDPEVTPRVLELLHAAGAQATFFCIGRRVERHPDIVAEIARRGHRVENHSHHHRHTFSLMGPGAVGREIDRAQVAIARAAGRAPVYFRAPAGFRNPLLGPLLARRGLTLVSWSRRPFDTVTGNPERVAARLVDGVRPGDILLLHDGSGADGPDGRTVVLSALPRVLDALRERGLRSVALPAPDEVG